LMVWVLLLMLPGLALLMWLPGRLDLGQRVIAAPAVTILALPVFFLVTRAVSLPVGEAAMWLLLAICLVAVAGAALRGGWKLAVPRPDTAGVAFWLLLGLVLVGTLAVRMLAIRDLPAGQGLDAYHHTLI